MLLSLETRLNRRNSQTSAAGPAEVAQSEADDGPAGVAWTSIPLEPLIC